LEAVRLSFRIKIKPMLFYQSIKSVTRVIQSSTITPLLSLRKFGFKYVSWGILALCFLVIGSNEAVAQACLFNEATFAAGGSFSGTCTLDVSGAPNGAASDITITGDVVWTSGTLTIVGNDGDINLEAILDIQGGSIIFDNGDGDVDIRNGGDLSIAAGASLIAPESIQVQSGGNISISGTLQSTNSFIDVDAGGSLTVNEGGTMDASTHVYIQGTMDISGTVTLGEDFDINGGNVTIMDGGVVDADDDAEVYGGGTLTVDYGGSLITGDDLDNNGGGGSTDGIIIINGSATVGGDVNIGDTDPDSSLQGSGTLDVAGNFNDGEGTSIFGGCGGVFPCTSVEIQNAPSVVNSTTPFNVTFEWLYDVTR
jgi:hypothetical protein